MSERVPTGTRVRSRRLDRGLRQSDVAKSVGISGSYLNLIEHNRRRIGGKLLQDLARVLAIDPALLEDETSAHFMAPLQEAAARFQDVTVEEARAEELVGRFPGWAELIVAQHGMIQRLTSRIETLSNRLTHDTQIAASLHEVISTATAIRSAASILAETPDLDRDWQGRFHRNIDGDSARLAESSQALLGLLDVEQQATMSDMSSVAERAEAAIAELGFHQPGLEAGEALDLDAMADPAVRSLVADWAEAYLRDAVRLPLEPFLQAARQVAFDPARLANMLAVPLDVVLRRLAQVPEGAGAPPMGLVRCDAAGVLLFQKPVLDFRLPRAGAGCPLWPLYQALTQPGRPIRAVVRMPGVARTSFECFAIAGPRAGDPFGEGAQIEATMLVRPARSDAGARPVGPGCRVCAVKDCASRRQPSLLLEG